VKRQPPVAESRTTERRRKGRDSVKRRRQNTQGRCKKQNRREEQGYSSAANLDSQHPHQDRGLASKNGSHLHPLRPARDGQMVCALTLVFRDW